MTQKSKFIGLLLLKSGLEFDLQIVSLLDFQVGQR